MKIDIHIHTKKTKSGDPETREINPGLFCETISNTDVKICAITNHNHFDKEQYDSIIDKSEGLFQVWPGVELDVYDNSNRGHLLVIVNPKSVTGFSDLMARLTQGQSVDDFAISMNDVASAFDPFDPVYIPHYRSKKPCISEEMIQILINSSIKQNRVLKEASNSISAGIFVCHGHKAIYGSDIQDWNDYINRSKNLPDLRLPVESFDQFCFLLDRDDSTIRTILDTKKHETISIKPFEEDEEPITLEIWDDINVLFGSKGTGKTEILKALSKYYNKNGYKTSVYESSAVNLDQKYDIKGTKIEFNLGEQNVDLCAAEMSYVRSATDASVTSLKKYSDYFASTETNKISKRIRIKNYSPLDESSPDRRFKETRDFRKQLISFKQILVSTPIIEEVLSQDLLHALLKLLDDVDEKVETSIENEFVEYKAIVLFNHLIKTFVSEISRKTGQPEKPIKTGFLEYARKRIDIEVSLIKIASSINHKIEPIPVFVGDLGVKGKLFCKTQFVIQNGSIHDSDFKHIGNATKTPQKNVAKGFLSLLAAIYTDKLFEKIDDLNKIENGDSVSSVEDLILFRRFFEVNYVQYKPSNGESAMILLRQELNENREIYLIDEPEKSLGNDYINDFIVPLLKEHAYSGKRVIIATHDANIAVRTLPYNTIYRAHDINRYYTYQGNPFSNSLKCRIKNVPSLDWKEISMRTLEGGEEAFGERGKIYAKS